MIRLVAGKDLRVLWASALPYVAGAVFHVVVGFLTVNQLEARRQAVLQPMFPIAGFLLLVVIPLLTMRSFAEEARAGTLDLLHVAPVRPVALVVGKWLACWLTALVVVAPAVVLVAVVAWFGEPDPGPAVSGFLGLVLLSALACAVGVATSATTASQAVAALVAVVVALLLWFAHVGSDVTTTGGLIGRLSVSERLRTFAGGVVDSADVVFFAAATAGALAVAVATVEARRRG